MKDERCDVERIRSKYIGKTDKERVVVCLIDTLIVFWNSKCIGITPAHISICEQGFSVRQLIVLSNENVSVKGNVLYAPVYMTMFLHHHKQEGPIIYHPELP